MESSNVIDTSQGAKNGQDKCPKCGATEISLNVNTGKLRCHYCRCEFDPVTEDAFENDISKLDGTSVSSGVADIVNDANDMVTFKCSSCGAEVVVDTAHSLQAKCHWCRNTLSVNQQIENGSVPDLVLPFKLEKSEAQKLISEFVQKRTFFAKAKFKSEFQTENILGVYLPYMIVDVNSKGKFSGKAEILKRKYYVKTGRDNKSSEARYDADLYQVSRQFDLKIEGLTIESNKDKANCNLLNTNNVINAILPFDIENSVKFNANYLSGYTSEKRDSNVGDLKSEVYNQTKDIARHKIGSTMKEYDRGISWDTQNVEVVGEQWKAAYLPIWLYSYYEKTGNSSLLHYVAVNARTKEVMGSVPIDYGKLIGMSILVEIFGGFIAFSDASSDIGVLFLSSGFVYFIYFFLRYRNSNARHYHEKETKNDISNIMKSDQLVKRQRGLRNSRISRENGGDVQGGMNKNVMSNTATELFDNISKGLDSKD